MARLGAFLTAPDASGREAKELIPEDPIDLSHECLMRQWRKLRQWMAEERDNAAQFRRLAEAWEKRKHEGLLTGAPLATLDEWCAKFKPTKSWAERYANVEDPATKAKQRRELGTLLDFLEQSRGTERRAKTRQWTLRIAPIALLVVVLFIVLIIRAQKAQLEVEAAKADVALKTAKAEKADAALKAAQADAALKTAQADAALKAAQADAALRRAQAGAAALKAAEADSALKASKADAALKASQADAALKATQADAALKAAQADAVLKAAQADAGVQAAKARSAEAAVRDAAQLTDQNRLQDALAYLANALRNDPNSMAARSGIFDLLVRQMNPDQRAPYADMRFKLGEGNKGLSVAPEPKGDLIAVAVWEPSKPAVENRNKNNGAEGASKTAEAKKKNKGAKSSPKATVEPGPRLGS